MLFAYFTDFEPLKWFMFWICAIVVHFIVTPLIYRRFHLRPMIVPRCPYCRDKNRWFYYEKQKVQWPMDIIICASCGMALELWYDLPNAAHISETLPSFRLLWPQSWGGRWRIISLGNLGKKSAAPENTLCHYGQ